MRVSKIDIPDLLEEIWECWQLLKSGTKRNDLAIATATMYTYSDEVAVERDTGLVDKMNGKSEKPQRTVACKATNGHTYLNVSVSWLDAICGESGQATANTRYYQNYIERFDLLHWLYLVYVHVWLTWSVKLFFYSRVTLPHGETLNYLNLKLFCVYNFFAQGTLTHSKSEVSFKRAITIKHLC